MTLSACGTAGVAKPNPDVAPNPVLQTVFETRLVCPAEVTLPIPPAAAVPAGAVVQANAEGDAYLEAKNAREQLLADRMRDAQAECPGVAP